MANQRFLNELLLINTAIPQFFRGALSTFALVAIMCMMCTDSHAAWLFYSKPAFHGRILDGETHQGIEGAAVVAQYYTQTTGVAGGSESVIHVREAVTDKDGKFSLPPYWTLIAPWSWSERIRFIIYKPGYVGLEDNLEAEFSGVGDVPHPNLDLPWLHNKNLVFRYREPNIVELPRAITREDRRLAKVGPSMEEKFWRYQPHLIKLLREEYKFLHGSYPDDLYSY